VLGQTSDVLVERGPVVCFNELYDLALRKCALRTRACGTTRDSEE
jgi:hypothetical protein